MGLTDIEWADKVWNPTRGCSRVSPGCQNCYAERIAARFSDQAVGVIGKTSAAYPAGPFHTFSERTPSGPRWTGKVELIESKLMEPLKWKKPARIFVNSMSDLFHEKLLVMQIDRVFDVMQRCPQHKFLVLTKRSARMAGYAIPGGLPRSENIRLGVSVEDQQRADERFPHVCELGEAGWNTMVSIEPLLGPVVVPDRYLALGKRAWVIIGGESGPGARPCDIEWIRAILAQCRAAGVQSFCKQLGADPWESGDGDHGPNAGNRLLFTDRKGCDVLEWPEDLRVREFPA
jgi:protein gp37